MMKHCEIECFHEYHCTKGIVIGDKRADKVNIHSSGLSFVNTCGVNTNVNLFRHDDKQSWTFKKLRTTLLFVVVMKKLQQMGMTHITYHFIRISEIDTHIDEGPISVIAPTPHGNRAMEVSAGCMKINTSISTHFREKYHYLMIGDAPCSLAICIFTFCSKDTLSYFYATRKMHSE